MKSAFLTACAAALLAAPAASASEITDAARSFVLERLGDVLSSGDVIAAVNAQNARTGSLSQADIDALDQRWRAGDQGLIEPTLANDLSQMLAGVVEEGQGAFSEIFVMDAKGLNVGQSARTSDYWQGDEAKWQATYLAGPDAIHVSDVEEDESTQTFQVQVSLPIVDGGAPIGAVTIGVDVEYLE